MARGGAGQRDEVLAVVHAVSLAESLDDFGASVLVELDKVVPSDLLSFNEVDPIHHRARVVAHPPVGPIPELDAWRRWSHQHPVLMHMLRTGDGSARRISDFIDQEQLHGLELYRLVYAPLGVEYQLSVSLPAPQPVVLGIALNRQERDFDDEEVALLDTLRPHLVQTYRSIQLLTEQRLLLDSLAEALEEEGRAFHLLGDPLAPRIAALLRRHYTLATEHSLPGPVAAWAELERAAFAAREPGRLCQPLVSVRGGRRLTARFVPGGRGRDVLFFDERAPERDALVLRRLGLTPREAEALWWLTRGASTAGIATELGVALGTAKKHLERVYRKLGVESRTAAVAQAFDVLAST